MAIFFVKCRLYFVADDFNYLNFIESDYDNSDSVDESEWLALVSNDNQRLENFELVADNETGYEIEINSHTENLETPFEEEQAENDIYVPNADLNGE